MEDFISCVNNKCKLNKAYNKKDVKKEDCYCTHFTYQKLQCKMFCEERMWESEQSKC